MKAKFIILTPVYNDWKNLNNLLSKINKLFINKVKQKFDLIIVDDSSEEKIIFRKQSFQSIKNLRILKNYDNLGSQRSIAIGLRYIKKMYRNNYQLIVIDSDGQDNPDGILKLIKKFNKTNSCVVAKRGQRRESLWFKTCYEIYCLLIFILSFKKIRFGNFSILRFEDVNNILQNNNLWGAFPPTLSLNLKKISFITIDREKRYSGNSKMNFFGLFYHAMRVFSVLRFKVLFVSFFYFIILFLIIPQKYFAVCLIFLSLLSLMNASNFILSFSNKINFYKSFKKVKVLSYR
tara:strand:- start:1139 stop:2011 length:873 start_codon:yes stop_codon:yes gene_type:complete